MHRNELYPVFLKLNKLRVLIVGGGKVAHEKLSFLLKSSPSAKVLMVATAFDQNVLDCCKGHDVSMLKMPYDTGLVQGHQLIIAATDNHEVNERVYRDAKRLNVLINVADTPDLCDFYLGGIVTKGQVKIAISTNGKSPTLAKRLRQYFEELLPEDIDELAKNLHKYRIHFQGTFRDKVLDLNKLTRTLLPDRKFSEDL